MKKSGLTPAQHEHRRLYYIWCQMRERCREPRNRQYADYGGRGIVVCDRWLGQQGFDNFLADMGPRPPGGLLDRKNNDKGYDPSNCSWATRKEQNSNRRNCIYVMHGDEKVTLKEYCRREGLTYRPIVKRIQNRGWTVEEALTLPLGTWVVNHRKAKT